MTENKKTKIFFIIFFLLIFISIGVAYYRYVVKEDYVFFMDEDEIPGILPDINNLSL